MGNNERPLFQSSSDGDAPPPRNRTPLFLAAGAAGVLVAGLAFFAFHKEAPPPTPPVPVTAAPAPAVPSPALDGAMVPVPGGTFKLGSTDGDADERPIVDARVASFEIDTVEVSVAAYRACVSAGKCQTPDIGTYCNWDKPGKERHPVNCVDAVQADAYCAFVGKRLPTEDEWDYAARGSDGRRYPWKDGAPAAQLCWNGEGNDVGKGNRQGTCPVGQFPAGASPFGALDMVGNVWEWTSSAYCPYDKRECGDSRRVIRGGGWNNLVPEYVRAQDRSKEATKARNDNIGLRCARTTAPGAR
jgi:formylglycine-generating enzyme required for sulfatase activity